MKDKLKNIIFSKPVCFAFVLFCVLVLFSFVPVHATENEAETNVDEELNNTLVQKYGQGLELLPDDTVVYDYIITDNREDNGGYYFYYFVDENYHCHVSLEAGATTEGIIVANNCYVVLFDQPNYDTPTLVVSTPSTVENGSPYTASEYIIRSSFDIQDVNGTGAPVFTQTPLEFPSMGIIADKIQTVDMSQTMAEILGVLPVVLIILVGLIGLRKGLAMLSRILRSA